MKDWERFKELGESKHVFRESPEDSYRCEECSKPRAQHLKDDFLPRLSPYVPAVNMDPSVNFGRVRPSDKRIWGIRPIINSEPQYRGAKRRVNRP